MLARPERGAWESADTLGTPGRGAWESADTLGTPGRGARESADTLARRGLLRGWVSEPRPPKDHRRLRGQR
jgi:hypothetical protein